MLIDLPNRPDVDGDLDKRFSELASLEGLNLRGTKTFGNIGVLRYNTKLKHLDLAETEVLGDLAALKNATSLKKLNLPYTKVGGDLTALQNAKGLTSLNLENTHVLGDLAALKSATRLKKLNLPYTKVGGDLTALQNAKGLTFLNLADTEVFGDLMTLQETTQLKDFQDFEVSNTKITCPQDAPLRAVLLKLGFKDSQLKDLHAMDGLELRWTLSCCKVLFFFSHIVQHVFGQPLRFGKA